ncbi:hypothetical protein [Massilia sp. Leaf139]|uniref:hypothetical protein n=1 Tax=Massilia sp. Leaf139 TaxID=1736272 RepID=UPI0006F34A03|nr:hypothetical protein [Massilia sp. Leaf139]KQQ92039.1 hypothetical protein ASF77_08960 [Massilia sp. Leaf139]
MKPRPGSSLWLLRHEVRMFWYTSFGAKEGTRRGANWRLVGGALLVWGALHAGVFALLNAMPEAAGIPMQALVIPATGILLATFLFMLSSGLKASVETLFDRGDMDLLMSSPLSSRSIMTVKLAGMVFGVAALYLFFLAPFAHIGLLLGQLGWLSVYPVVCAMAALAASLAMLSTLGMVRVLGARRTRVVAQVVGALAGALLFLLSQVGNFMSQEDGQATSAMAHVMAAAQALDPGSPLLLPARAMLGDPGAIAIIVGLGLLAVLLTIRTTDGFFVRGLQQAAGSARARGNAAPVRYRFHRSLATIVIVKEWRLVWRDPHLISQVMLQLLYLLPLCLIMFRKNEVQTWAVATGLTMLAGSLSASLAWIIVHGEDAPDLLLTAPVNAAKVRLAKLAAAFLPVFGLVLAPLVWLTLRAPLGGVLAAATVSGAVLSAALVNMWTGRPTPRGEFKNRGKRAVVTQLFEVCTLLAWGGLSLLLPRLFAPAPMSTALAGALGAAAAIALGAAPLAWLLRRRVR